MWSEEAIGILEDGWARGLSASEIVRALSAKGFTRTRNAVIGKAHRLGLAERGRAFEGRPRRRHAPRVAKARTPRIRAEVRPPSTFSYRAPPVKAPKLARDVKLAPSDPSILAAEALLGRARDAERRRDVFRSAGRGVGGWA